MNPTDQLIQLLEKSKLSSASRDALIAALRRDGLTATNKELVRQAFDHEMDQMAQRAGIDPRNNEAYVDAVAELIKKVVNAKGEMAEEMMKIESEAQKITQSVQGDIDAIQAAKVQHQIHQS